MPGRSWLQAGVSRHLCRPSGVKSALMPSKTPKCLPLGTSLGLSLETVSSTHRATQGLPGTYMCFPHHGGPPLHSLSCPSLAHPSRGPDYIQCSPWGLKADGTTETVAPKRTSLSSHHPPLGPLLGKSRVRGRKDTDGLANGAPGLSLKERAIPLPTGSTRTHATQQPSTQSPRPGKATAGQFSPGPPSLEEGPASHLLTEASLRWSRGFNVWDR